MKSTTRRLALAAMFVSSLTTPARAAITIPDSTAIPHGLTSAHPRLLLPAGGFDAIARKVQQDTVAKRWYNSITSSANSMLTATVSTYVKPDGIRLLSVCRTVLARVYALALVYQISKDTRYSDRAWAELSAAARFPDWNPSHYLDVGEMSHAFAVGYDWLYPVLSSAQRDTLATAIANFGFATYLDAWNTKAWWLTTTNNWNTVCNGGMGMAALAIAERDTARCGAILYRVVKSLDSAGAIRQFAPDGAWFEGPGYWDYATQYLFTFTAACSTSLHTTFGISATPGLAESGGFPVYMTGPTGKSYNFADAGEGTPRGPWLFWMSRRYAKPVYAWYEYRYASPAPMDLVWCDSTVATGLSPLPPLDAYFRTVEVTSFRSSWTDKNSLYVGFKAGTNGLNHGHLDIGSFVIDALGQRFALDLGGDDYNLPAYFGNLRWTYYRLRAEGHNTLVLNPDTGVDQSTSAKTVITRFFTISAVAGAVADLSAAYPGTRSAHRGMALIDNRTRILLQDKIMTKASGDLYWFMHTAATVTIAGGGRSANLDLGSVRMQAKLLFPSQATFTTSAPVPLPNSPNPAGQNANTGATKLTIHLSGVDSVNIGVLFTPVKTAADTSLAPPAFVDVDDPNWPTGIAAVRRERPASDGPVKLHCGTTVSPRPAEWGSEVLTIRGERVAAGRMRPLPAGVYVVRRGRTVN